MRTFKNFLLMGLLPILAVVMTGCKQSDIPQDEPTPTPPAVEKDSKIILKNTVVSASLDGGSYILEYTIENPHDGEKISAEPEADWVNNFNYNMSGALGFSVDANPTDAPRECIVTVKYRYAEDVKFTVKQGSKISAGFQLENVTADYFTYTVDVIPEDKTTPYIVMSASPEYVIISGFEDGEDYYEDDVLYFSWLGQYYGMSAVEVMRDRAKIGVQRGITVSKGASGVPYTFYCYYFDNNSGALLSDVHLFTVETAKPELQNVTFNVESEIESCLAKINVTPVGYEGDYYFDVLPVTLVDSYIRDFAFLTTPERTIEYWWSISVQDMMQELSADQIIANYTCVGNNPDGSPKSYYEFELLANSDYYLFAYTMEEHGLCSSVPQVVKFTTGDVEPSDNVITPSVSNLTSRTATITFTTTNSDYYVAGWEKASDWATFGSTDAERQAHLLANNVYELISGNVSTNVLDLEADTEYVAYAFGSRGGVATTEQIYTKTFKTKSGDASELTISFKDLGYYDCADFANYPGYEYLSNYSGYVVFAIEVEFSSDDHGAYFFDIYDWTNRKHEVHTDEDLMDHYVWSIDQYGSINATHTYTFLQVGRSYELSGVVLDNEGQFSSLWRQWIEPTFEGCRNAADYVAWWDAYQDSLNGGVGLQSLVYEEKSLFKAKGSKNLRYSEQESRPAENKVVSADEIVATRVR